MGFDQERYDIVGGQPFSVRVQISPVPLRGLFSYGLRITGNPTNAQATGVTGVQPSAALDFHGVLGSGAGKADVGLGAAKGTVNLFSDPLQPYTNALLGTFVIRDRAPGPYLIGADFFNTLGVTEGIFVDGDGTVLDSQIVFGTALINRRPDVQIVTPSNNQVFLFPTNVTITVRAADADGSVTNLELLIGSNIVAQSRTAVLSYLLLNIPAGSHTIVARATDNFGAIGTSAPVRIAVTGGQPIEIVTPIQFNRQSGLFEQTVRVRNIQGSALSAVRVVVRGLPASVRLFNATGSTDGGYYVQYNQALAPGTSIDLRLEYYTRDRVPFEQPDLIAEAVSPEHAPEPIGMIFSVSRSLRLADDSFLVEFNSLAGRDYAIQYSLDLNQWTTAVPFLSGTGSRMQWIDNGPPKTDSFPAATVKRFYRVVLLPE